MKIEGYKSFLESIFSKKENCCYYYSQRLREILSVMYDTGIPCSSTVLHAESSTHISDDITFFDITDDDGTISFIQTNRLTRMKDMDSSAKDLTLDQWVRRIWRSTNNDLSSTVWTEQRTTIAVGRFLTRLFQKASIGINDKQKEHFVNAFKSRFKLSKNAKERFEIVSGEDIKKWYSQNSYEFDRGQLANSCMRYDACQSFFNIYIKNPEVCKLLILHGADPNKIVGRALVWELSNSQIYLDRVYTNIESDKNLFMDYADEQGWVLKHGKCRDSMEVKIKELDYSEFPYMDTFLCFNHKDYLLSSDESKLENPDWWELRDTGGGYTAGNRVWSDFHGQWIDRDDAVMCSDINDWVDSDQALYLEYKDTWVGPNADTCYSTVDDRTYLTDDCSYSELLDTYIYNEISMSVYNGPSSEDIVPLDYKNNGMAKDFTIDGEKKMCLVDVVLLDPFTNKWVFKKESVDLRWCEKMQEYYTDEEADEKGLELDYTKLSTESYTDYLVRKINGYGEVDTNKLYEYLKSVKPTTDMIDRINKYFSDTFYLNNERTFTNVDKFNIVKLALWIMDSDKEKRNYNSRTRSLYQVLSGNKQKVEELIGIEKSNVLFANHIFINYFVAIANILLYDIITDKEMLKIFIVMKMS